MDGRNVGASNSGGSGRPKLVRPGISIQRENTSVLKFGSTPTEQDGQAGNLNVVGSLQKPQDSALSFLGSKASAVDNISRNIASSSSVVSAERPKVLPAAAMSEGLSSLVSYSSSSTEASGSEDNGQEDQLSNVSSVAKSKYGVLSDVSSENLVKKMQNIASNQDSQEMKQLTSTTTKKASDLQRTPTDPKESNVSREDIYPNKINLEKGIGELTNVARATTPVESEEKRKVIKLVKRISIDGSGGSVKGTLDVSEELRLVTQDLQVQKGALIEQVAQVEKVNMLASPTNEKFMPAQKKNSDNAGVTSGSVPQTPFVKHPSSDFEKAGSQPKIESSELKNEERLNIPVGHVVEKGPENPLAQISTSNFDTPKSALQVNPNVITSKPVQQNNPNIVTSKFLQQDNTSIVSSKSLQQGNTVIVSSNPMQQSKPDIVTSKSLQQDKPNIVTSKSLQQDNSNTSKPLQQDNIKFMASKSVQQDDPYIFNSKSSQQDSRAISNVTKVPSTILKSTEKLGGFVQSHVMKDIAQVSPAIEKKQDKLPSSKNPEPLEEKNEPFDPIEEQLKLITEGHPMLDLETPDLKDPSLNVTAKDLLDSLDTKSPSVAVSLKEMNVQRELESAFVPATQQHSKSTVVVRDEEKNLSSNKKEDNAQAINKGTAQKSDSGLPVKEVKVNTQDAGTMEKGTPMEVTPSQKTPTLDVKEASLSSLLNDQRQDSDVIGNKRTHSTLQEQIQPQEKRMKVDEMTDFPVSMHSQDINLSEILKVETEKMEVDESSTPKEVLPTFEKLSEDLEASKKICVEEDSKNSLDDSSVSSLLFKDKEEKEDKDDKDEKDDKDDDASTPSSRKKRNKKKCYERPRGEGGKFRKERPGPSLLDEETRMEGLHDEDSQGSTKREVRRFRCEVIVPESTEVFTADKVVEYVWPLEGCGEHYYIQEQISQYLGIMSFKRKYPDLRRRPLEMQERDYLKDKGLVSEMACDLGLTAVRSEDVLDVMVSDFPSKFEELQRLLRERKENEMKERGKVNYSMANLDKSKMQEYLVKAAEDSARWNAAFNREKREERKYSFDLQTCSLQMPTGRYKKLPPEYTKIGAYPVAVLPGQYTDYYREYTTAALKSMPLNTVMCAPITNDTLGSDGAGSDSEEDGPVVSLSGNDVTDGSEVKEEKTLGLPQCKVCTGTKHKNKGGTPEPLIICSNCRSASHPTCIDLTLVMVPKIESYDWQCMDCKSCVTCSDPDDEDKMIFCDMCDRGYHIFCVGLRRVPNGRWHCKECAICSSCGSKSPAGSENAKNAEWQHEFKKDKNNKQLKYATTLCVPCDKYWKRRQFCYVCLKVYRSIPEDGMVRCSNCPKYIHREGCSCIYENERFCNNCFKIRNSAALNHSRIIAAAKKKMASGY